MFLIIDNSEEERIIFSFLLNNNLVQRTFKTNKTENILVCMEKALFGLKLALEDIKCFGVVVGAGRFTAVRLSVTVVNTLAFCLKRPVVGLSKNFSMQSAIRAAKSAAAGKYVLPKYSGEARIGR